MINKRTFCGALAATAMLFAGGAAQAQEWKPEQITIILPHGVGGGQDRQTRELGAVWSKYLGVPVVYENVRGASGRKGYDYFLKQPKDGSFVLSSNLASAAVMYKQTKADWDWRESIVPLGIFGVDPGAFFARKDAPYQTLEELTDYAKDNKVSVGLAFWASPDNIVVHQVMQNAGVEFQVVPIGGGADTVTAVLAGHVNAGFTKVANIQGNDDMRFLGVAMNKNPVPGLTNEAPAVADAVGTKILSSASYRGIAMHKEVAEENPELAAWLSDTLEQAKDDPEFIAAAERDGVHKDLIVDMSREEIMEMIEGYWDSYDRFGDIYNAGG